MLNCETEPVSSKHSHSLSLTLEIVYLSAAAGQFAGSVAYMSDSQEQLSKQMADLQALLSKVVTSLNPPFIQPHSLILRLKCKSHQT